MSIKDRIRRLESRGGCPECYLKPAATHAVYPGEEEPEPESCPGCGRSLGVVIRVVYEAVYSEEGRVSPIEQMHRN
jgi:hypothetical protein